MRLVLRVSIKGKTEENEIIDTNPPQFSFICPSRWGNVDKNQFTASGKIYDSGSGLASMTVQIYKIIDKNNNKFKRLIYYSDLYSGEKTVDWKIDNLNLDDGDYRLGYYARDTSSNDISNYFDFTVDTTYSGN